MDVFNFSINGPVRLLFLLTFGCLSAALLFSSCRRVETFEASIIGFEESSSHSVPSFQGLKLDPSSSDDGPLAIRYERCEGFKKECDTETFLATADKPGIKRTIRLDAGGATLSAKDLRIGQRVHVNFALRGDLEPQTITVNNYVRPTRFLRLDLKSSLPEQTDPYALSVGMIESLLIAHLSWRLPPDVGIIKASEVTENYKIIGELEVWYGQFSVDTQWMIRNKRTGDRLTIQTRLADPAVANNWSDIKVSGGSHPEGNEAFSPSSWSYKSGMMQVPMFEITRVE